MHASIQSRIKRNLIGLEVVKFAALSKIIKIPYTALRRSNNEYFLILRALLPTNIMRINSFTDAGEITCNF
jgi:hypothetical protein